VVWVLGATLLVVAGGLAALRRVAGAEAVKLAAHPFVRVALVVLVVGIPLYSEFSPAMEEPPDASYRRASSFAFFGSGLRFGFHVAAIAAVVLGALSFAGEFDRGTIKNLLMRPVTRTELFAGKLTLLLGFASLLFAGVVFEAALWACARGELHHVWRRDVFEVYPSYAEMMSHAQRAAGLALLPLMAASILGVAVSTLTESSALAVALALGAFFGLMVASGWLGESRAFCFAYYPGYGIEVLEGMASGDSRARWNESLFSEGLFAIVPVASAAAMAIPAWLAFRARNITA